MRAILASRTVIGFATLMLLGACNDPFSVPSSPDPSVVSGEEQAPKPKPQIDKGTP